MVYADNVKDWNNLVLTKDFLDMMDEDPDDVRHVLFRFLGQPEEDILPAGSEGHPKYLAKYPGKTGDISTGNPQDNDLCILRLSEVYLNAAEAAFKLGGAHLTKAAAYLNAIVSLANPARSVGEGDLSLDRILKERRKELVGEGHAFFEGYAQQPARGTPGRMAPSSIAFRCPGNPAFRSAGSLTDSPSRNRREPEYGTKSPVSRKPGPGIKRDSQAARNHARKPARQIRPRKTGRETARKNGPHTPAKKPDSTPSQAMESGFPFYASEPFTNEAATRSKRDVLSAPFHPQTT